MRDLSSMKLNDLPVTRINGLDVIICSGYKKDDNSLIRVSLCDLEHLKKDYEAYDKRHEAIVQDFYNFEDNAFCLNVIKDKGICGCRIADFFKTTGSGQSWLGHEDIVRSRYNFYLTCYMNYKIGWHREEADKFFHFYYDVDVFVRWVKEVLNNHDILSSEIERYYDVRNRHFALIMDKIMCYDCFERLFNSIYGAVIDEIKDKFGTEYII